MLTRLMPGDSVVFDDQLSIVYRGLKQFKEAKSTRADLRIDVRGGRDSQLPSLRVATKKLATLEEGKPIQLQPFVELADSRNLSQTYIQVPQGAVLQFPDAAITIARIYDDQGVVQVEIDSRASVHVATPIDQAVEEDRRRRVLFLIGESRLTENRDAVKSAIEEIAQSPFLECVTLLPPAPLFEAPNWADVVVAVGRIQTEEFASQIAEVLDGRRRPVELLQIGVVESEDQKTLPGPHELLFSLHQSGIISKSGVTGIKHAGELTKLRAELEEPRIQYLVRDRSDDEESVSNLELEIEVPDDICDEELIDYLTRIAVAADALHRAQGGHGIDVEHVEVHGTVEAGVPA